MNKQQVPRWALERVTSVIESERRAGRSATNLASLAQLAGVNKDLVRRCLAARTRNSQDVARGQDPLLARAGTREVGATRYRRHGGEDSCDGSPTPDPMPQAN